MYRKAKSEKSRMEAIRLKNEHACLLNDDTMADPGVCAEKKEKIITLVKDIGAHERRSNRELPSDFNDQLEELIERYSDSLHGDGSITFIVDDILGVTSILASLVDMKNSQRRQPTGRCGRRWGSPWPKSAFCDHCEQ